MSFTTSEVTDKVWPAFVAAWAKFEVAKKDTENPFHKSKYADYASVMEAIRPALIENKLAVVQSGSCFEGNLLKVVTRIVHESGQFIQNEFSVPVTDNKIQAIGSLQTYVRRYGLSAISALVSDLEDDDGNKADNKQPSAPRSQAVKPPNTEPKTAPTTPKSESAVTDDALKCKALKIDIIARGVTEDGLAKYYFGIWGEKKPLKPSVYVKPLTDLLNNLSNPDYVAGFNSNPEQAGVMWREKETK